MIRFGTDGVRGPAGVRPITAEGALAIGKAAARLAEHQGGQRVLIARDTRPSGPMLVAGCAAGAASLGAHVTIADVLPTSAVMAALADGIAEAGIMVTASHNPAADNGFKVLDSRGKKLSQELTQHFEEWVNQGHASNVISQITHNPLSVRTSYHRALEACAPASTDLADRTIVVDLAHGAATLNRRWLKEYYPATDWVFLGTGEGIINDGVGSEYPEHLASVVLDSGADAGIAVDGDGDRCVLVDERGRVVHGDKLAWLLAVNSGVRSMAVTVMSTSALEPALPGVHVHRTPVGDKHLMRAMAQHGLPLGCEESGHVLFSDGLPGGDGLLTGLRALANDRRPLSDQLTAFKPFPRVKGKVKVNARLPLGELAELQACVEAANARLDGGRVFLRYSGTEPVLRVLVEGPDQAVVEEVAAEVTQVAQQVLP